MHLLSYPNSCQMIYDLQQEIKGPFYNKLPGVLVIDIMVSIIDTLDLFSPIRHLIDF